MTMRHTLLLGFIPGFTMWSAVRRHQRSEADPPFIRSPRIRDVFWFAVGIAFIVLGLLISFPIAVIYGATLALHRLALRLLSPNGWFSSEREFIAASTIHASNRFAFYMILLWELLNQNWVGAIVFAGLIVATSLGELFWARLLERSMFSGDRAAHA